MKMSKEAFIFHDASDAIEVIEDKLSLAALYEQLAEEATEVAQAALKLSRILRRENPTPVLEPTAVNNLEEEFTDLTLVSEILNLKPDPEIRDQKAYRWAYRLLRAVEG